MSPVVNADTVQRIRMGRIVTPVHATCDEHGTPGWICGWGEKPKGAKGGLVAVGQEGPKLEGGDIVYDQLRKALPKLKEHALPLEEGPYADKDGSMAILMDSMGLDTDELEEVIERTIDLRPFIDTSTEMYSPRRFQHSCSFIYKPDFVPPTDELTTAGGILTQDRMMEDETTGASHVAIYSLMEMYVLAVSALRRKGLEAYPAMAVTPHPAADEGGPRENLTPLIVLVDLAAEVPMKTFDLQRIHPPLGALDIISDEAMVGITYVIQAEARMKNLTVEKVLLSKEGKPLEQEELDQRLDGIATSLFEAHKRWPGTQFITDALRYFFEEAGKADMAVNLADLQNRMETLVQQNPILRLRPDLATSNAHVEAMATAQVWVSAVERLLAAKIAGLEIVPKAQPEAKSDATEQAPAEAPHAVEPQAPLADVIRFPSKAVPPAEAPTEAVAKPTAPAETTTAPAEVPAVQAETVSGYAAYRSRGGSLTQAQYEIVVGFKYSMKAYIETARLVPPKTTRAETILATRLLGALGGQVPFHADGQPDMGWVMSEVALLH